MCRPRVDKKKKRNDVMVFDPTLWGGAQCSTILTDFFFLKE